MRLTKEEKTMLEVLSEDPTATLSEVKMMWASETGKNNPESILTMLEAKDLVILNESDELVMLTPQGLKLCS
tara:strand:+ start:369 stop:584 length:216 start_codon:yes stop_codon:yes gene_type:complete